MTYTKNIFFNTLAQYSGKVIALLSAIVVTYVLTHKLGVANYGQYVYIYALVLFVNSLADWGSTFVATREASRQQSQQNAIYSTTIIVRLVVSLIFQLILLIVGFALPSLKTQFLPLLTASFLLPILSLKTSFQVVFQSKYQLWRLSLIDTLSSIVFMAFVLFFAHLPNFASLIFVYLSLSALVGTLTGIFFVFSLFSFSFTIDYHYTKLLLTQSLSMGALLTLFSLYDRVDIFILKYFKDNTALGIYGFSYKVYGTFLLAAGYLANSTFPLLSSRSTNTPLFKQTFEKYLAALLSLALLASVTLFVSSPLIVSLLAGSDFQPAVLTIRLLSISLIGAFLGHSTGYSLVALNKQLAAIKISISALVLNIVLNLILIPHFSYNAAAFVTILTELTVFVLGLRLIHRHLGSINLVSGLKALRPRDLLESFKK